MTRCVAIALRLSTMSWLCDLLTACSAVAPAATQHAETESPTAEQAPSPIDTEAPESNGTPESPYEFGECLKEIERREWRGPSGGYGGDGRYTLSMEEFTAYMSLMGIESLCIPAGFGGPFLNVDWNDFDDPPAAIGRMVSIGFEQLYAGSGGWGSGCLVYSTYDFEGGTMYQVFATREDLEAVPPGLQPSGASKSEYPLVGESIKLSRISELTETDRTALSDLAQAVYSPEETASWPEPSTCAGRLGNNSLRAASTAPQ